MNSNDGPQEAVSFTVFWKLRPKQCVFTRDSSAMNVCVCMIHENMKFLLDALGKTECFVNVNEEKDVKSVLIEKSICANSTEACFLRSCSDCSTGKMIDFVAQRLEQQSIKKIKYCFWTTSPR